MPLEWKKDYETGKSDIDGQHKELFKIINQLLDAIESAQGRQEVEKVLTFLHNYVSSHFETEEKYMRRFEYPRYQQHKEQHALFAANYISLQKFFDAYGPSAGLVDMINRWVSGWFTNHILQVDMELGAFLNAKELSTKN